MRIVYLTLSLVLLTACGQKGSLYMPEQNPPIKPSSPNSQP